MLARSGRRRAAAAFPDTEDYRFADSTAGGYSQDTTIH